MEESVPDLARMAVYLAEQPDVIVAYHFGSTAAGKSYADSDVDIAVLLDHDEKGVSNLSRQVEILNNLDEMDTREVQVTLLNDVSSFMAFNVIRDGAVIFERDKAERVEFEVMTMKRYFDFKPILEYQNRALARRIKEVGLGGSKRDHLRSPESA